MTYKIAYHIGNEISIKTKVMSGDLSLDAKHISISGFRSLNIGYSTVMHVEMFRIHGLGRIIKVVCSGFNVYLTVIWLNLFGYFVVINYIKTGNLYEQIQNRHAQNRFL